MIHTEEWGTLFEPGEWIKHKMRPGKGGLVIEAVAPQDDMYGLTAGWYRVLRDDGTEYIDYHYVFCLDEQRTREEKLNELLPD